MRGWFVKLGNRGLAAQLATLALAVLVVYALLMPVAGLWRGVTGLLAAAVSGAVCLLGASLALVLFRWLCTQRPPWQGILAAMAPRMGIPLGAALVFALRGGPLVEAGLLYYLVVFYLATLGLETGLSLLSDQGTDCSSGSSQDVAP